MGQAVLNHSLNFKPLPSLISRFNHKFDYVTLFVLNWSLISQNFSFKSYLYQNHRRKTLKGWSRPPPPPPLRPGRVKTKSTVLKAFHANMHVTNDTGTVANSKQSHILLLFYIFLWTNAVNTVPVMLPISIIESLVWQRSYCSNPNSAGRLRIYCKSPDVKI